MVLNVTRHDVNEGTDGDLYIVRRSDSGPSRIVEIFEEDHVRTAEQRELLKEIGEASLIRVRVFDIAVLLEPFDRRFIAARNPKQSVGEHSLPIDQVSQQFLDTPFALGVSEFAFLFRQAGEDVLQMGRLRAECANYIAVCDKRDVSFIVRIVFRFFRPVHILDFSRRSRICMTTTERFLSCLHPIIFAA